MVIDFSIESIYSVSKAHIRGRNKILAKRIICLPWRDFGQRSIDARWMKKDGLNHYGYKNHIDVDVKHKLIRSYEVTPASVHDSEVFEDLLGEDNSSRDVWADSAYRSEEKLRELKERNYREHLQRKGASIRS